MKHVRKSSRISNRGKETKTRLLKVLRMGGLRNQAEDSLDKGREVTRVWKIARSLKQDQVYSINNQ